MNQLLDTLKKKKIDIFMYSSEGMYYSDKIQSAKYPVQLVKKIKKILVWGKNDAKYLLRRGFKNKVVNCGLLKFDKRNYSIKNSNNKKITRIGIPTHLRIITGFGRSKLMIPSLIRQMTLKKDYEKLGLYKFEYEYIQLLTELIKEIEYRSENGMSKVLGLVSNFLIFFIVLLPPQISLASQIDENFLVKLSLFVYLIIEIISLILLNFFFRITLFNELQIISISSNFFEGILIILEFPLINPKINE